MVVVLVGHVEPRWWRAGHVGHRRGTRPSGVPRRPPAALRASVVALGVLLLGSLGALGVLSLRPDWFSGLRAVQPGPEAAVLASPPARAAPGVVPTPASTVTPVPAPSTARPVAAPPSFHLVVATPTTATYAVPATSYTIDVVVDQPCWMALRTPPSQPEPTFSATLLPGRPTAITVRGPSSVMVAARADAVEVRVGDRLVGSIPAPVVGLTYRFEPARP